MDKELLQKYFRNQCTLDEVEQVLKWFKTKEGTKYLEEMMNRDMERYAEEENLLIYPGVPTDKLWKRINLTRKTKTHKKGGNIWPARIAVVFLICAILAGGSYFGFKYSDPAENKEAETTYRTISTLDDQHRIITLSDGTLIRLNANSSIRIPETFLDDIRPVELQGEAWFEVTSDENRPFQIKAAKAHINVLGTEFNVKIDTVARNVQVAVADGSVSLSDDSNNSGRQALLTQNTFAIFNLDNEEILIEESQIQNYVSWISGRLYFYNEPLWVVSRYLERLYQVQFQFETDAIKNLPLSTDMTKEDIIPVLNIIATTLGIDYQYENNIVLWTDNTNNKIINHDE